MHKIVFGLLLTASTLLIGCSEEETARVAPHTASVARVINVAVSPASPPTLYEQDGQMMGSDYDIFSAYCKSRGCTMKITAYDWQGMLAAISSGQAEVAFSGIGITERRRQAMDFSEPYSPVVLHLVALDKNAEPITDLATLKSLRIGYPRGMAFDDLIKEEFEPKGYYSTSQSRLYPSYLETVTDLRNGNIDLAFIEEPVLQYFMNRLQLPIKSVYPMKVDIVLGFAFAKGSALRDDFNQFLVTLGPTKIAEIITNASK